jgi:hypothetical protein
MDRAKAILKFNESSNEKNLTELLKTLSVTSLKDLCREVSVKRSGNKTQLIGHLLTYWADSFQIEDEDSTVSGVPAIQDISVWTRDISSLTDCNIIQIYKFLISRKSKDNIFRDDCLKAFKSLKAYKYFSDGLVQNVWAHTSDKFIAIKAFCFSSLKSKAVYSVSVIFKRNGDIMTGECQCVAGKGETCSHVAALLFYMEDLKQRNMPTIPSDVTVTDRLQQWNVPPKRTIQPLPVSEISFNKAVYGKQINTVGSKRIIPSSTREEDTVTAEAEDVACEELRTKIMKYPMHGLSHFWSVSDQEQDEVMSDEQELTDISSTLMSLAHKLVIFNITNIQLPQSALDLASIDINGVYFMEACQDYISEQVLDDVLKNFIEQNTTQQAESSLWKLLHNGRLTSSMFGEIMKRRESSSAHSILRRIMGYSPLSADLPQLKWGREKEAIAWDSYVEYMRKLGHKDLFQWQHML